jgi:hypothetical protein
MNVYRDKHTNKRLWKTRLRMTKKEKEGMNQLYFIEAFFLG